MNGKEWGNEVRRWICLAGAGKEFEGIYAHGSEGGKGVAGARGSRLQGVRGRRSECEMWSAVSAPDEDQAGRESRICLYRVQVPCASRSCECQGHERSAPSEHGRSKPYAFRCEAHGLWRLPG